MGPEKEAFFIDPGILSKGGAFFPTALKREWQGEQKLIELPEEQPRIFKIYAQWLYTGKIFYKTGEHQDDLHTLGELYTLAERLMDHVLQDRAVDALNTAIYDTEETNGRLPHLDTVNHVCEHAPSNSPMRQLLRDLVVRKCSSRDDWSDFLEGVNRPFLNDVVCALGDRYEITDDERKKAEALQGPLKCKYHHHGMDQPCPSREAQ